MVAAGMEQLEKRQMFETHLVSQSTTAKVVVREKEKGVLYIPAF